MRTCQLSILALVTTCLGLHVAASAAPASRTPPPPDWFHIVRLDDRTFELSEPKYWQENVSYLLLGKRMALLFDTGPGVYSIRGTVEKLTHLPLIVIPSHLHFDHVGDLAEFNDVRLLDTPALRAQVNDGEFVEPPSQVLLKAGIRYPIAGWVKDGESIDLGERVVRVISTPGHTPDSVSVIDEGGKRVFAGDLMGHVVTLVDVPGSDIHAMAKTLHRLLQLAPPLESAYEAHSEKPFTRAEVQQFAAGADAIAADRDTWKPSCLGGVPMKRYDVGPFPILLPSDSGQELPAFTSSTQTLEWLAKPCGPD
jgi:glyoxylase-like metal-dependent hydrolase (beta-lactamase superfamily II)